MTQDDIIRMAREAGLVIDGNNSGDDDLFAFANLVAARAAALERESCAKVCEAGINNATDWDSSYWDQCCENRAAAIRARGNT
jgi:hypothetical protein